MKTNRWIELSQRFYHQLLRLYPQAYRITYETEMFRVFTDQCREAYQQRGRVGILLLWLRTLVDVGKTVVVEHISDPNARAGLLEAVPGNPLPWKGVFLVLIPGLIFFISQVTQVTSNKDWFFYVYYRAAFFLIVPVLLVWLITHRFPVWGLIPLGLLYTTLVSYNPAYLISRLGMYTPPDSLLIYPEPISPGYLIAVSVCAISLFGLIWHYTRGQQISRSTWKWLWFYGLLIILRIAVEFYNFRLWQISYYQDWTQRDVRNFSLQMPLWYLYDALSLLLLIFIGKIFTRTYRGLSFLLLLGYMLPTLIFGRYGNRDAIPFSMVVLAVMIYRFVVALLAPVWLARTSSIPWRQRAAVIPISVALFCHIALNVINDFALAKRYDYFQINLVTLLSSNWNQLLIVVGLGLAMALYFPIQKENNAPLHSAVVTE